MALAILFLCLVVTFVCLTRKSPEVAEPAGKTSALQTPAPRPPIIPGAPAVTPPAAAPEPTRAETASPGLTGPLGKDLAPGHFPGIQVRHDPAAEHSPGEPEAGVMEEITTPSGQKFLRVRTDERHAIPVMPPDAK